MNPRQPQVHGAQVPAVAAGGRFAEDRGSVMLETVLVLPLILTLILGAAQFAHMWMARQMVAYAAYCAARAALVCSDDECRLGQWTGGQTGVRSAGQQAAEQVCAWVVIGQGAGEPRKQIPGWGEIPGSGSVRRKTQVRLEKLDPWNIKATVRFDFGLVMPIAGPVIGWAVNPREWVERRADVTGNAHRYLDTVQYPHVRFEETAILSKPYVTLPQSGLPAAGW